MSRSLSPEVRRTLVLVFAFTFALGLDALSAPASAAPGDHDWSHGFGIDGRSDVGGLGDVFSAGNLWSAADLGGGLLTPQAPFGGDVYLARHDDQGNHVFSLQFVPDGSATIDAIAADENGRFVIAGKLYGGSGGFGSDPLGRRVPGSIDFGGGPIFGDGDCFLAGFDRDGNHLFSMTFGDAFVMDLATAAGRVAVTGYTYGTVDFGGGPFTSAGDADVFVGTVDFSGAHQWSGLFGAASGQGGMAIGVGPSQEVVLAATTAEPIDFGGGTLGPNTPVGLCLVGFDAVGQHQFSSLFDGAFSSGAGIYAQLDLDVSLTDGRIALAGQMNGTVSFGGAALVAHGSGDAFVAQFDGSGAHEWSAHHGGTRTDYALGVAFDPSQNVFVTGLFASDGSDFGGAPLPVVSSYADFFTALYDPSGAHLFSRGHGGPGQWLIGAGAFPDGRLFAWGGASGGLDFGGGALDPASLFHVALDGTSVSTAAAPTLRAATLQPAAPNPFNPQTTIRFRLSQDDHVALVIHDVQGRRVRTLLNGRMGTGEHDVRWNGEDDAGRAVASGTYFCRLLTTDGVQGQKLTLVK